MSMIAVLSKSGFGSRYDLERTGHKALIHDYQFLKTLKEKEKQRR